MQRKLTDAKVKNLKLKSKGYKTSDGGGLYVFTNTKGSRSFRYDFKHNDKYATVTFGQYPTTSLAEARKLHEEARNTVLKGLDPREENQTDTLLSKPFSYYAHAMVASQDLRASTIKKKLV